MPPSPPSFRFWQTFNPISTRMGRLCPPHYYLPPPTPDYFQTFLRPCMYMTVVNVISLRFPIVFKVGSRGPCPLGQLVVFEKYSGKSYRGECGCSPGYNQNYWPETGQCFEWYTQGPCKDSFLFQYNRDSGEQDTLLTVFPHIVSAETILF